MVGEKKYSVNSFLREVFKTHKKEITKIGEKGVKLSMGQRQRITITMAFLKNPRY